MTVLASLVAGLRGRGSAIADIDWLSIVDLLEANSDQVTCTRHPLGFVHLEITSIAPVEKGERLRLHYWPREGSNADEIGALHDHVWDLASVVAAGRLRDRTFRLVSNERGKYRGSVVVYGTSTNHFADRGRFELAFEREIVVAPGEIYRIPSRTVHDSEIVEAPAVTFVLARDDENAATMGPLVLHAGAGGTGTAVRESFDCGEALVLVRHRLAEIVQFGDAKPSGSGS